MNKLKSIMPFIGIFFVLVTALSSCQKDETETVSVIITDDTEMGIEFIEDALTPNSCTFETYMNYGKYVVISPEKSVVENFISRVKETLDVSDLYEEYQQEGNLSVQSFHKDWSNLLICYDLSPDTKYYYVTIDNVEWKSIVISNVKNFTTPKYDSIVDLGLSVNWCGYNYVEGESEMKIWDTENILLRERPDDFTGLLSNYRYPTGKEVNELNEICEITMVDFNKKFIRLTSSNGKDLYVPFTWANGNGEYDNLALFPCKTDSRYHDGVNVIEKSYHPSLHASSIQLTKGSLDRFNLLVVLDFYDLTEDSEGKGKRRGIRFVVDR